MAFNSNGTKTEKAVSALCVLAIHVGILLALIYGLHAQPSENGDEITSIVTIDVQPPAIAHMDSIVETETPAGTASPANVKSRASEVVAPKANIPLPTKTDITAAQKPMDADDISTGAADEPGEGTGAGGAGDGTGSGGQGDGTGGGNIIARAQKISGQITQRDYPKGHPRRKGVEEVVVVHYTVLPTGRVANCRTAQSSGNPALDMSTCQLVTARFRYRPARNASGKAVPDVTGWKQVWWVGKRR